MFRFQLVKAGRQVIASLGGLPVAHKHPAMSGDQSWRDRGMLLRQVVSPDIEDRAACLQIEDSIRWITLRKEGLFRSELNNLSPQTGVGQKGCDVKTLSKKLSHGEILLPATAFASRLPKIR
jgi:hypothetical protein